MPFSSGSLDWRFFLSAEEVWGKDFAGLAKDWLPDTLNLEERQRKQKGHFSEEEKMNAVSIRNAEEMRAFLVGKTLAHFQIEGVRGLFGQAVEMLEGLGFRPDENQKPVILADSAWQIFWAEWGVFGSKYSVKFGLSVGRRSATAFPSMPDLPFAETTVIEGLKLAGCKVIPIAWWDRGRKVLVPSGNVDVILLENRSGDLRAWVTIEGPRTKKSS